MEDDFINDFRFAYESQNANALVELAYPVGLNQSLRSNLKSQFQFNFMLNRKLLSIEIQDIPEGMTSEKNIDGVIYRPNLVPTAGLEVMLYTLDESGNKLQGGNFYLIGEHNGKLYIIPDVPIGK